MGKYSILIILLSAQINISSQKGECARKSSLLINLSLMLGSAGLTIKPDYLTGLFSTSTTLWLQIFIQPSGDLPTEFCTGLDPPFFPKITKPWFKETLGPLRPHNSHLLEILFGELLIRILFQVSHMLCIVASKSWAFPFLTSKLFSKRMV